MVRLLRKRMDWSAVLKNRICRSLPAGTAERESGKKGIILGSPLKSILYEIILM